MYAGSSKSIPGIAVRQALAVAIASLMLQEKLKCKQAMGTVGAAIVCGDEQVTTAQSIEWQMHHDLMRINKA